MNFLYSKFLCTRALLIIAFVLQTALPLPVFAKSIAERLSGRILLQAEEKGKAWYVEPTSRTRAYLGRPTDAFRVMRELGLGIAEKDIEKIPTLQDTGAKNKEFARRFSGKILLQVQKRGEAWYVNPLDLKRYYLGRPADAFGVMKKLGLGVSNADVAAISVSEKYRDFSQAHSPAQLSEKRVTEQTKSGFVSGAGAKNEEFTVYAGSYRCWSYNVSGGGSGDCRLFAPIVLAKDGTYSMSSEKGTYHIEGDAIILSESKIRGPGKMIADAQIRFEYDYNSWHHTITYLKESAPFSSANDSQREVPVQVILEYPEKDSALNSIATLELVPEGEEVRAATYKPTTLAVWDGDRRITALFQGATNTPRAGKKYTVYANTGFSQTAVGTVDLLVAKELVRAFITVSKSDVPQAQQTQVTLSTAPLIVVEIDLIYPERDSSLGSLVSIVLIPEGEDHAIAIYKPTALAIWDGDRTVSGSFHKATNQVKTGVKYTVYADWGREMIQSGTLDLTRETKGPIKKIYQTTILGE